MRDEKQKNIDDIFRQALNDPANEPEYRQEHWAAFEETLNGKKKSGKVIYWLPLISGVAAMTLVTLGWWYLTPRAEQNANFAQQVMKKKLNGTGTPQKGQVVARLKKDTMIADRPDKTGNTALLTKKAHQHFSDNYSENTAKQNASAAIPTSMSGGKIAASINPGNITTDHLLLDQPKQINPHTGNFNPLLVPHSIKQPAIAIAAVGTGTKGYKETDDKGWFKNPRLAVTVLASTDVNGLSSFSAANAGQNVGMLFSARFNKLSISTGAYYSFKPYTVPFSSYNPSTTYRFRNSPESVTADCRMLDIPLNIDYQIFAKNKNTISIGTGISSFIMLKESYKYNYANASAYGSSVYSVKDPDKYLFSSVNFQANYRRQINSKIGVNVMPYVKIPFNDIGYSKVKLQTMGVAVGINWNINPLQKPK